MNIGSIYLFELVFLSSLDKHPEVELLDHMVAHIICNLHTVFLSGCTNFHSTNNTQSFSFSTSSHVVFWITGVLTGMSDISLRFWLAFPWWSAILSTFLCTCWPCVHLVCKNVYSYPLCVENWIVWFFVIELCEFFIYFG